MTNQPSSSGEAGSQEIQLIPLSSKERMMKTTDAVGSLCLPSRSTKKKKPTLDRVLIVPMVAPGREDERDTRTLKLQEEEKSMKQTEVTYLVDERL
jgi:hypothetical protein